jgi:hypothetical protein
MTLTATRSTILGAPQSTLLGLLRSRGLRARVVADRPGGEPDVRLQVHSCDRGPTVELLCWPPDETPPPCWDAVRVEGADRQVWRGPAIAAAPGAVLAFVSDLLSRDPAALEAVYRFLG